MLFKKFTINNTIYFVDEFNEHGILCHAEPELGQRPADPKPISYAEIIRKHRLGQLLINSEKFSGDGGNDHLSSSIDLLVTKLERDRLKREEEARIEAEKKAVAQAAREAEEHRKRMIERERNARAMQLSMDDDE